VFGPFILTTEVANKLNTEVSNSPGYNLITVIYASPEWRVFRPFILTTGAANKLNTEVSNSLGYNPITVAQSFVLQNGELHTTFCKVSGKPAS